MAGKLRNTILLGAVCCLLLPMPTIASKSETREDEYVIALKEQMEARSSLDSTFPDDVNVKSWITMGSRTYITVKADDLEALSRLPNVDFIQANRKVSLVQPVDVKLMSGSKIKDKLGDRPKTSASQTCQQQYVPYHELQNIWGLIRTSYNTKPSYDAPYKYTYDGTGVDIYFADTGIEVNHPEFGGRASHGMVSRDIMMGPEDREGHGTHVASIAAGNVYGVAKGASIISVKVLPLSPRQASEDGIAQGIAWVVGQVKQQRAAGKTPRAIINMSLGGTGDSVSALFNDAIQQAINEGIIVIVAAGNGLEDANRHQPANQANTIAVGATDKNDQFASFSNYGPMVNISAPGVDIGGAYSSLSPTCVGANLPPEMCYVFMSGTSQATALVSGVVARYLSSLSDNQMITTNQYTVASVLGQTATKYAINSLPPGTPNMLLYKSCGLITYSAEGPLATNSSNQTNNNNVTRSTTPETASNTESHFSPTCPAHCRLNGSWATWEVLGLVAVAAMTSSIITLCTTYLCHRCRTARPHVKIIT